MTALDWGLIVVWLGIALSGFWKGAVRIVFGLGGLLVGVWLAVVVGGDAAELLAGWIGEGWVAEALGHILPAAVAVLLCVAAGWGIDRTLEALHLGWLNRVAGALIAGAAGLLLLAVLLGAAVRVSPTVHAAADRSLLAWRLVAIWEAHAPQAGVADTTSVGDGSISR